MWLLEHEYSEDGLSFDTLKNTDAAVAKVLLEAADRAEFELNAAVLRIEEWGSPEFHPVFDRWGADWEDEVSATMGEVNDRWEVLDGWAARDGSRPPFGELPLEDGELLPRDALDDALPDEERLKGSTGNTGPTLELTYRYAALVAWPREKTVDILAGAGIDGAVAWAAIQCARARDTGDGTIRRLLCSHRVSASPTRPSWQHEEPRQSSAATQGIRRRPDVDGVAAGVVTGARAERNGSTQSGTARGGAGPVIPLRAGPGHEEPLHSEVDRLR